MSTAGTRTFFDDFRRAETLSTTPGQNGWTKKDNSPSGSPTMVIDETGLVMTLAATSEAEILTLYQNDVLAFPLEDGIQYIEWAVSVSGVDANTDVVFGVASAQNDTLDSVQEHAWWRIAGGDSTANLVAETDDNTTDNDDKATGTTLAGTIRRLKLDFSAGLDDVKFRADGSLRASGTTFDMQAASDGLTLQPFVQLQKSTGTGTPQVTIRSCEIKYAFDY